MLFKWHHEVRGVEPIRLIDCYFRWTEASSLKHPSDQVPFKPKADIIITATAHAPAKQSQGW